MVIFFTRAVNAMTPRNSNSLVAGFFYVRDLVPVNPPASFPYSGCAASNEGEMFYVLAPDPEGVVSTPRSKAFVQSNALSIIAHEMQHLTNYARRLYVHNAPFEEKWLDEGLAHVAQELVFYRAAGVNSRANLTPSRLGQASNGISAFNQHVIFNWTWLLRFMERSDELAVYSANDQEERGAAWSYLRYLADRRGAADGDLWMRLANSRNTGFNNLREVIGNDYMAQMRDWTIALYLDDLVAGADARYSMPSWHTRQIFQGLQLSRYPLRTVALSSEAPTTSVLRGGSSLLYRVVVPAGGEAMVKATSPGGSPLSPSLQLSVIRIR